MSNLFENKFIIFLKGVRKWRCSLYAISLKRTKLGFFSRILY